MAKMIPAECDLQRRPMSEQIVFATIEQYVSDEWYVFQSFDYVTRDIQEKRWDGEIDFLFFHPVEGFLILEVKGGAISYKGGEWYQAGSHKIDPFEQAKRNKYAVRKFLEGKLHRQIPLKFAHAVCFPGCGRAGNWPHEAQELVLTQEQLPYIESFVRGVLQTTQLPEYLEGQTIAEKDIMSVLSPVFEYGRTLADRIGLEQQQTFYFTEQQCALLDELRYFKKLVVCGCAGSGKTVMAVKKAERLAHEGKQVLMVCLTDLLAERIRATVQGYPEIKVASFGLLAMEYLQLTPEQLQLYRNDLDLPLEYFPRQLKKYLEEHPVHFDAVIVDEGQDFSAAAWDVIQMVTKDDGYFYIFCDLEQDVIGKTAIPDFGFPPVMLTKNCRNTRKIFNAMKPYIDGVSEINELAAEGEDVRVHRGNCRKELQKELERLVEQEGIQPRDIVILGANAFPDTDLSKHPNVGPFTVVNHAPKSGSMEVSYYSYLRFKGCESNVVILYEVDESSDGWSRKDAMYTAMSRALYQLIILKK